MLLFLVASCSTAEDEIEEMNPNSSLNATPKALGGFVYRMNHHGNTKCPTKGQGCSRSASVSLDPVALSALDLAVGQGATGIKDFFRTGPFASLFPNLQYGEPAIYADLSSGSFSAIREVHGTDVIYSFGSGTVTFENATYHFVVND
jgi:hypothetical protein